MIVFDGVDKQFADGAHAVKGLSLEIFQGETLVLLGRSGSGKTTTMKMINRLVQPSSGRVFVNGVDIATMDPIDLRRQIGYAIQSIGLFPHMTVAENIAIGPILLKWERKRIAKRVRELLELVGLDPDEYLERYPHELSGGQRQRVGVARALAADPPIILMDEPFGALDPITRYELQNECLDLFADLGKTVVFVTHDVFEAVKMGDRIALFEGGRLVALETPEKLVHSEDSQEVAAFIRHQHFQLCLATKTLGKQFPQLDLQNRCTGKRLSHRFSLIEALDIFKDTNSSVLPVYDGKQYLGALNKEMLMDAMIETMRAEKTVGVHAG